MTELGVVLIVIAAVVGLFILLFWILPWWLDSDDDESIPVREVIDRIEQENQR